MEVDYHTSSLHVEELKSNEFKLLKQVDDLEQQKRELSDLRMRDLDTQANLQTRSANSCIEMIHCQAVSNVLILQLTRLMS